MQLIFDVDRLLPLPFVVVLVFPEVDDVRAQRGAAEAMRAVGVVVELDLERHQPVFAEVHGLYGLAFLEIPNVEAATVLEMAHLLEVEARHEGVRRRPFRADHHVVARLIPEVVAERDVAHRVLPAPHDLEVFVDVEVTAGSFAPCVTEEGDDDLRAQAVNGVWPREVGLRFDLVPVDDRVQRRRLRVGRRVHDVDVVRTHSGQ